MLDLRAKSDEELWMVYAQVSPNTGKHEEYLNTRFNCSKSRALFLADLVTLALQPPKRFLFVVVLRILTVEVKKGVDRQQVFIYNNGILSCPYWEAKTISARSLSLKESKKALNSYLFSYKSKLSNWNIKIGIEIA